MILEPPPLFRNLFQTRGPGCLVGQVNISCPGSAEHATLEEQFAEEREWQFDHLGWLPLQTPDERWNVVGRAVLGRSYLLLKHRHEDEVRYEMAFAHVDGTFWRVQGELVQLISHLRETTLLPHERTALSCEAMNSIIPLEEARELPEFVPADELPEKSFVAALEQADSDAAQSSFERIAATYPIWLRLEIARRAVEETVAGAEDLRAEWRETIETIARRHPIVASARTAFATAHTASTRVHIDQVRKLGFGGEGSPSPDIRPLGPGTVAGLDLLRRGLDKIHACLAAVDPDAGSDLSLRLAACHPVDAVVTAPRTTEGLAPMPVCFLQWFAQRGLTTTPLERLWREPDPLTIRLLDARIDCLSSDERAWHESFDRAFPALVDTASLRAALDPDHGRLDTAVSKLREHPGSLDAVACAYVVSALETERAAACLGELLRAGRTSRPEGLASVLREALQWLQRRRHTSDFGIQAGPGEYRYRLAARAPDSKGWTDATLRWLSAAYARGAKFDFHQQHAACEFAVWLGDAKATKLLPSFVRRSEAILRKM